MSLHTPRAHENTTVALSSIWTASRGTQVVHCELLVPAVGRPILRCGYGPHAVIRSQCIPSEDAAPAIAEIWKAALLEHGFRVQSTRPAS
jgi:hypothetical protein